jgi:hypothetical protein
LQGGILDEGWEPGEAEARNAAVEALQWETA